MNSPNQDHRPNTAARSIHRLAAESNYWTLSIQDLDGILDRLETRETLVAESRHREMRDDLKEAIRLVRGVRDRMLSENYDANRKGEGVVSGARSRL